MLHGEGLEMGNNKAMDDLVATGISDKQKTLMARHGTPAGFAMACYELVPGTISMDEAKAAIEKYQAEWDAASDEPEKHGTPKTWDEIPGYLEDMR